MAGWCKGLCCQAWVWPRNNTMKAETIPASCPLISTHTRTHLPEASQWKSQFHPEDWRLQHPGFSNRRIGQQLGMGKHTVPLEGRGRPVPISEFPASQDYIVTLQRDRPCLSKNKCRSVNHLPQSLDSSMTGSMRSCSLCSDCVRITYFLDIQLI